jgi:hypothetical protein
MMAATPMPCLQRARVAANAVDDRLDVGAVVADEHQQQAVRAAQRGEGMPRTMGIVEFEVDGLPAKVTNRGIQCHDTACLQTTNIEQGNSYNTTVNCPRFHCPMPLAVGAASRFAGAGGASCGQRSSLARRRCLTIFNGAGGEYRARIAGIERTRVSVEVSGWLATEREPPLSITLVQALQAGEKMDLTVQKAVELGVDRIVPVISRRSVLRLEGERALRRLAHWRGVVAQPVNSAGATGCRKSCFPSASNTGWREIRQPVGCA